MNNEGRGPWYMLTGLIIGLALGLAYAWLISPVQYVDTSPDALMPAFKDQYRSLIAMAYKADGDLGRARGRLGLLKDQRPVIELGGQAQRILAQGGSEAEARALAQLAADYGAQAGGAGTQAGGAGTQVSGAGTSASTQQAGGAGTPASGTGTSASALQPTATLGLGDVVFTPTPVPQSSVQPMETFTPRPQPTAQPTQGAPFALKSKDQLCDPGRTPGLLEVDATDGSGNPLAGVHIDITWDGGSDTFYTGLYPEISPGYADFVMVSKQVYSLRVGEGGQLVSDLSSVECKSKDGKLTMTGWVLKFVQP